MHVWRAGLKGFPKYDYIIDGITNGFKMGVNNDWVIPELISADPHYIPMTFSERQAITEWILKGLDKGYMSGPYTSTFNLPWSRLYCAPLFTVKKPIGYRPIVHLSWNRFNTRFSINDLLCEYMKTVKYITFREVVNMVNNAGLGAFIFLIDAQDAYYRVPTHPDDWKYNGIKWGGYFWVFTSLQMGLSSSPKIYTEFADAVEYICVNRFKKLCFLNGLQMLRHYIDDFFAIVRSRKDAQTLFDNIFNLFKELGIPTRLRKCEPPSIENKILGWLYNTLKRTVRLPDDKRENLLSAIDRILKLKCSDRKSMERLLGHLQNASLVIFPGKAFVRRLEAVLYLVMTKYDVKINMSDFVLEDLRWWRNILSDINKCSTSFDLILKTPSDGDFNIYTDATTTLGFGGFCNDCGFQVNWNDTVKPSLEQQYGKFDISTLELLVSIVAILVFASKFRHKAVSIHNDNPTASKSIRTKAPPLRRLDLQFLVRRLATAAVDSKFYFWGIHTTPKESSEMVMADQLSRLEMKSSFFHSGKLKFDFSDQARVICNSLLREIINHPILENVSDIDDTIRMEYKILWDDEYLKLKPKPDLVLLKQKLYNILYKQY